METPAPTKFDLRPRVLADLTRLVADVKATWVEGTDIEQHPSMKLYRMLCAQAEATYGYDEVVNLARQAGKANGLPAAW